MPRRTGVAGPPKSYVLAKGTWPDGPFRADAPASVRYAAEIAKRLRAAVHAAGLNVSEVARGLGVARSTYYDLLKGETYPDLHTVARAEEFLHTRLWPDG